MAAAKIKVYTYTRVSTTMQVDGYSLEAQKTRMRAFADYNEYEWLTYSQFKTKVLWIGQTS